MFPLYFYMWSCFALQKILIFKNNVLLNEARGDETKILIFKNNVLLFCRKNGVDKKI